MQIQLMLILFILLMLPCPAVAEDVPDMPTDGWMYIDPLNVQPLGGWKMYLPVVVVPEVQRWNHELNNSTN